MGIAVKDGLGVDRNLASLLDAASVHVMGHTADTALPRYSSCVSSVPAASATDIALLVGSASKQIRVRRVTVSAYATGTAATAALSLNRHAVANTGGTRATGAVAKLATAAATPAGAAYGYSANATVSASAVLVASRHVVFDTAPKLLEFLFDEGAMVLSGAAEELAVALPGTVDVNGGDVRVTFEWTEH